MQKCQTRLFISTTDTGYDFFTHTITVTNSSKELHDHDYVEIILVLDGIMSTEINGRTYKLPPNSLIFLRPEDKHYIYAKEERHRDICYTIKLFKEICDFLSPDIFHSYMTAPEPTVVSIPDTAIAEIERISQKISFNIDIKMTDVLVQIKTLGIKLLDLLLNETKTTAVVTHTMPDFLEQLLVELEINSNISDKTLDEILEGFHYNKAYIRRVFKKYMKIDLQKYWLDKKLTRAATLLRISTLSVKEISLQCGFRSYAYFNKTFIARYKVTPYKYKTEN